MQIQYPLVNFSLEQDTINLQMDPHAFLSRSRPRARINLYLSWVCYGINLLVLFLLSPFLIEELGTTRYGLLALINALTGYLGIAEFGTQSGLSKFLNHYLGLNDSKNFNRVLNSGIVILAVVSTLIFLASLCLTYSLHVLFPKIPTTLLTEVKTVLLITTANLIVILFECPSKLALQAIERFDLTLSVKLGTTLLQTLGTIFALIAGESLIAIVTIQTLATTVGLVATYALSIRCIPWIQYSLFLPTRLIISEIASFSAWSFVGSVGLRSVASCDAVMIGILLGPQWVAAYVIGDTLSQKISDIVDQVSSVYLPRILQACTKKNDQSILENWSESLSTSVSIGMLGTIGLISYGSEFIELWLGSDFESSYRVMTILCVSRFLSIPFRTASSIFAGLNFVRTLALLYLLLAGLNLMVSPAIVIWLKIGSIGVAYGSLIANLLVTSVGLILLSRMIKIEKRATAITTARWVTYGIIFYGACVFFNYVWPEYSWGTLVTKSLLATAIYSLGLWCIAFSGQSKSLFLKQLRKT